MDKWLQIWEFMLTNNAKAMAWIMGIIVFLTIVEYIFPAQEGQTLKGRARNVVYMVLLKVMGLEVFEEFGIFEKLLPKIIGSYALDAMEIGGDPKPSPNPDQVKQFLEDISHAEASIHPGVGKGSDIRISDGELEAGALLHEDRVLHLVGFRMDQKHQSHPRSN